MTQRPPLLIIGAGITGLTLALALRRRGLPVRVFEQAKALREVGAGITVGPNAGRVLAALGLEEKLDRMAFIPRRTGLRDRDGRELQRTERGREAYIAEFGMPFRLLHRADLLALLREALGDEAPIHCDHRLVEVSQDRGAVHARFANGVEATGPALIACDGLKSTVRSRLFDDGAPQFTGYVSWRGLAPGHALDGLDPELTDLDFEVTTGPGRMFTRYPIRDGALLNFVAIARDETWREEHWMAPARREETLERFGHWHPGVTRVLEALPEDALFKWALHVREPLPSWSRGRVALAGDAAHPMTPFLGLGAGMGMEDAWVLAELLARDQGRQNDPNKAFGLYEAVRLERAHRVQRLSARQGLELLGERSPSLTGPDPLGIYGYDVTAETG